MLERCYNPESKSYRWYGGSGVTVCPEWLHNFQAFYRDMGDPPDGMSLDRQDNTLGYSRENCRWATALTQANNRRNTIMVEWEGEQRRLADLCRERGLSMSMVRNRIVVSGWDIRAALSEPSRSG